MSECGGQVPSIGRVVHYVPSLLVDTGRCQFGLIVGFPSRSGEPTKGLDLVNIQVLPDRQAQPQWYHGVPYSADGQPNTWHWPQFTGGKKPKT